ncbi:MAG: TonB-dependent receptor [Chitinophagaceae bacterium]|nr:MAG: TonB-dependent receptor [Chitinophagaceae bacterium]
MCKILQKGLFLSSFTLLLLTTGITMANAQSIPVTKALKSVTKIFGTRFVYEKSLLEGKETKYDISHLKGKQVEAVLKGILYPEGLVFLYVKENYYTIIPREQLRESMIGAPRSVNPASSQLPANTGNSVERQPENTSESTKNGTEALSSTSAIRIVHGRVIDSLGNPLAGVSIHIVGTTKGTITDADGAYSLQVAPNAVLEFSNIGYITHKVNVGIQSNIDVVMRTNKTGLSQVVVIGYGTQREVDLTGAVSTISAKEISRDHSVINATDMLEGRIPGLFIMKNGGAPGSGSDMYVRGLSTFNNSSPLVVIDGIPGRSLDDINPNDIASISVLKDAASVAVYGARAANGVILVTTKRGTVGKPEITFSMNMINQRPTQIYKQLNSYQYVTLYNEALKNEDSYNPVVGSGWNDAQVQAFKDGTDPNHYPNTNWYKELISPSIWQSTYNLSASGGTENTKYYLSAGYVNDNGLTPVEGYKRYNLRGNITTTIARNLKLNLDLAGIYTKSHGEAVYGSEYVIGQVYSTSPIRVNKFTNGDYAFVPEQRGSAAQQALGQTGFNDNDNNVVNSNLSLTYDLPWVKGLSVKGLMAYDKMMGFKKSFAKPTDMYSIDASGNYTLVPGYPTAPYLRESYAQDYSITLQGSINYDNYFGSNHVTGMLLYEQSQENTDNFSTRRDNFVSAALAELNLGDPTRVSNSGTGSESARQGVVGRFTYDYKDKYLAEFNFRYDGSDIFPPNHRFGFFPSVSAGWVLSEEPFFKDAVPAVNFLKIRGSWGQLGNDQVNPFQFLSTYSLIGGGSYGGGYTFGGTNPTFYQSLNPNVLPNPNFTWERAVMTDVGVDASIWEGLLSIKADYFKKRTKNILAPPSGLTPDVIGISLPDQNSGIVDNSGFEIEITHRNDIGKFSYYISPNISFSHNKVVYFPESSSLPAWQKVSGKPVNFDPANGISAQPNPYLGQIGYHSVGLYQTKEQIAKGPTPPYSDVAPGDIEYADIDHDGKITANDMEVLDAHFFPGIQYGIKWGCSYGGLELNVLMQGAAEVSAYNTPANYGFGYTPGTFLLDHWTPANTNAPYPRLFLNYQNNQETSDYWIVNTAYMRVKNVELGYHLPQSWLHRIGAKQVLITVGGNNLLTFTKFKMFDPESAGQVRDPLMKSYTASLMITF